MLKEFCVIVWIFVALQSKLSQSSSDIAKCYVKYFRIHTNESEIYCRHIGLDGRPLDDVLRVAYLDLVLGNWTWAERASTITEIRVESTSGPVSISENGLAHLSKLKTIYMTSKTQYQLNIWPNEFRNTPRLDTIHLETFDLTNNTVAAIENLANLKKLNVQNCTQSDRLLEKLNKLGLSGRLTNLNMSWLGQQSVIMIKDAPFPTRIFEKSPRGLTHVYISHSQLPTIMSKMFRGMKNLTRLWLVNNNTTSIQHRAFDDLINLQGLNLDDNTIKRLPHALFDHMKKLQWVSLRGNRVEGVSQANFSHCENFLVLDL